MAVSVRLPTFPLTAPFISGIVAAMPFSAISAIAVFVAVPGGPFNA